MRFLSTVQHGVYAEPENGPGIVGHSDNDIDQEAEIVAEQSSHVRHAAIDVSLTTSPLQTFDIFRLALQETQERELIPLGYGVAEGEWTGGSCYA